MFDNPLYYVVIVAALLGLVAFNYLRKRRKRGKVIDFAKIPDSVNCRIMDNIERRVYNKVLPLKDVVAVIGRQYFRDTEKTYGLYRDFATEADKDGEFQPVYYPFKVPEKSSNFPAVLYGMMQQSEMGIIMQDWLKADDKSIVEKYGYLLVWIAGMAFLAFLWSQS